jgi:hypothetical protein
MSILLVSGGSGPDHRVFSNPTFRDVLQLCVKSWKGSNITLEWDTTKFSGSVAEHRMALRLVYGALYSNTGPGIGCYNHKSIVIVGDRPSPTWRGSKPNWPFISSYPGSSAMWLANVLESADIPELDLYWVNAFSADGTPANGGSIFNVMHKVVALGSEAHKWALQWVPQAIKCAHPTRWMLHKKHAPYPLTKIIRDLQRDNSTPATK